MSQLALANINNLLQTWQQADIQPSEEPIFVLTSTQLQDIISRAVQEATEPLYRELATPPRKRIAKIEQREPQPLQRDRGEILRALLAANSSKMLRSQPERRLHLSESRFSELLGIMRDYIEVRPFHFNTNQKVLVLK